MNQAGKIPKLALTVDPTTSTPGSPVGWPLISQTTHRNADVVAYTTDLRWKSCCGVSGLG